MGFAAFEPMGYALTVLIATQGQIHALEQVLFTRNLLSRAGHAAWTGLVCAADQLDAAEPAHGDRRPGAGGAARRAAR
jgi:RsiW-degrading membrane proteinase PrsW (M82 family)